MSTNIRNVLIILFALALLGVFLKYVAYGGGTTNEEVKERLVTELERFEGFDEHRSLLLAVTDRESENVYEAIATPSSLTEPRRVDWDTYRPMMYRLLGTALREAGRDDAAIRLDQFRARGE